MVDIPPPSSSQLILSDTPLYKLGRWNLKNYQEIQSQFSKTLALEEEIQASVPFYLPFLVHLLRPGYALEDIQEALGTNQLGQLEFKRFQDTLTSRKVSPCLLNTLGDHRIPHCQVSTAPDQPSGSPDPSNQDDFDLSKIFHVEKIYPSVVCISIYGYRTFNISKELQKRASRAKREQQVCARIERPGTRLVQFDWSPDIHTPVVNKAFNDLVRIMLLLLGREMLSDQVLSGILCREELFRQSAYLRHDHGIIQLKSRSLQIIIPTESPESHLFISLSSSELSRSKFNNRIAWKIDRGLLLEQGTTLSTTRSISFISIVTPIAS